MLLRPLQLGDLDGVESILSDPRTVRLMSQEVRDRDGCRLWLDYVMQRYRDTGFGFLAAELKENRAYAGHAGLLLQDVEDRQELEIAYWFVPAYWGRGLATEAATALRDYGFEVLGRSRLVSLIEPTNAPSIRVAEKTGLTREHEVTWKGRRVCVYSIRREPGGVSGT